MTGVLRKATGRARTGVLDTPANPGRITSASRTRDFAMFFPPLMKQFRSACLDNRSPEEDMTDRRRIRTVIVRRVGLILAVLAAGPVAPARAQVASTPQFEKDVLPVLTAHCVKCHGG